MRLFPGFSGRPAVSSAVLGLGVLVLSLAACSDADEPAAPATGDGKPVSSAVFVGEAAASQPASIAVLVGAETGSAAGQTAVYVCNGVDASTWLTGSVQNGALAATAEDGSKVDGTVAGGQIVGKLQLAGQAPIDFTVGTATGVAGLYLVKQTATSANGFSAQNGARLQATIGTDKAVSGDITPAGGSAVPLAGSLQTFGETEGEASWIVQADGRVRGRATFVTASGTAGGGNCSVWSKIKSLAFGVDCSFF